MQDERSKLGGKITISSVHTQFAGLRAAGRVCTNTSGDAGMKKASTRLLEQETQTPSPAPDLIPLNHQLRTYIGIGTANGGTSSLSASRSQRTTQDGRALREFSESVGTVH